MKETSVPSKIMADSKISRNKERGLLPEVHLKIMQASHLDILKDVHPANIRNEFFSVGLIDHDELHEATLKSSRKEEMEFLLYKIYNSNGSGFKKFIDALERAEYYQLADKLKESASMNWKEEDVACLTNRIFALETNNEKLTTRLVEKDEKISKLENDVENLKSQNKNLSERLGIVESKLNSQTELQYKNTVRSYSYPVHPRVNFTGWISEGELKSRVNNKKNGWRK